VNISLLTGERPAGQAPRGRPGRRKRRAKLTWANMLYIYRSRLRSRNVVVQDACAVAGIAVGVGLLFAAQVASTSLTQSVQRLSRQLVGNTQYQLDARGPGGVNERILTEAAHLPGVKVAIPVLEMQAQVVGAGGQARSVDLIGTDPQFARFGGPLLRKFSATQLAAQQAIVLPTPIAEAIGANPLQPVHVLVGARVALALVGATLDSRDIGALVNSPVALTPVAYAQQLTGMTGRLTRVFIQARRGRENQVRAGLDRLAAREHVNLESANYDARLFAVAAMPENQGETLFEVISAIVGFLLAINAMLITVPRRRRTLKHIKQQGANRMMLLQLLIFDASAIGVTACAVGFGFGDVLSLTVFHAAPGYLSFAFPVGSGRIVTWQAVVEALAAGMLAAYAGMLLPLRDSFTSARWRSVLSRKGWASARIGVGAAALTTMTLILIVDPAGSDLGNLMLVLAMLCVLPSLFELAVATFARLQPALNYPSARVALTHLRVPGTRVRSLAIVATAAVAVFGVVSIQGAQQNLQRGLDASATGIDSGADIWVSPRGESNAFATTPFSDPSAPAKISRLPGVASISEYRGSFVNWGDRRLWVLGPSTASRTVVPPTQIVSGNLTLAESRLRQSGWAVISREVAAEHGLRVGQTFVLPSPVPTTFRVAALSTNLGWPPGAVIINAADYSRAWGGSEPSAYEIETRPGFRPAAVRRTVQAALGTSSGLIAETARQRERRHYNLAKQGLLRLTEIRYMVLVAAMLAVAIALGSLIWQRRAYVAFVRALGFRRQVLRRWLFWEGAILLGIGCVTGAGAGIYGQLLMSHALASVTGFPISFDVEALVAFSTLAIMGFTAALVVAVAGGLMVRVPPRAARATT
jgi:putative ABC transport system permease protein